MEKYLKNNNVNAYFGFDGGSNSSSLASNAGPEPKISASGSNSALEKS